MQFPDSENAQRNLEIAWNIHEMQKTYAWDLNTSSKLLQYSLPFVGDDLTVARLEGQLDGVSFVDVIQE